MVLLSICIPSYNRFDFLKENLASIFKANSEDFEVIIVDNASPNCIYDHIPVHDKRLRIVKRDKPVDGKYNVWNCLSYASGRYAFLCLDKDLVDGNRLDDFLVKLKENEHLKGGYCAQNTTVEDEKFEIVDKDAILKFGYLGRHPSGYFFRKEILEEYIGKMNSSKLSSAFTCDIFLAACSSRGSMMYYDAPLVYLETKANSVKTKSYAYGGEGNSVYFLPQNRIIQFEIYANNLHSLGVETRVYNAIMHRLYSTTLFHATFELKKIMQMQEICEHYYLSCKDVTLQEMMCNKKQLNVALRKMNLGFLQYKIRLLGELRFYKWLVFIQFSHK